MIKSLVRTVAPTTEPVTLPEAKAFLRVDSSDDDAFITTLITAARESVENFTGRALILQTWRLVLSEWPSVCVGNYRSESAIIALDRFPLAGVTSVKYYPADGTAQATLSSSAYHVLTDARPGLIVLKSTENWPALFDRPDAVEIIFTAGAASAAAVEKLLCSAVLLQLEHLYENRGAVAIGSIVNELPYSLQNILESHRVGGWLA